MTAPGVWAEDMAPEELTAALPLLGRLQAPLHVGFPTDKLGVPALAQVTRRAHDHGVRVHAWLLLPTAAGYWLGTRNTAVAATGLEALLEWRKQPGGPWLDGISFDLEPPHAVTERFRTSRGVAGIVRQLRERLGPETHDRARARLGHLVARVREEGLRAHCVTYPLVLDQQAGSTALEEALEIPASGVDWDEISFMTYQTAFAQQMGTWFGPALVASYAQTAVARYGERAGLDLGVVGPGGVALDAGSRYPDPASLARDVAAAVGAGIPVERIRVYGLAGMLAEGGVERWLARCAEGWSEPRGNVAPVAPASERRVSGLRSVVSLAARVLAHLPEPRESASP